MTSQALRILALYDYKGWAWWHRLHNIKRHLPSDIELDIRQVYENFSWQRYDFFLVFESYLLPLLRYIEPSRIIAGSSTLRTAQAAREALRQGQCRALVFNSWEMYALGGATPTPHTFCCQNGVDEGFFTPAATPPAAFTACWVGNSKSICEKGLDIIKAACAKSEVPLLYRDQAVAQGTLSHEALRDNYYRKASVYVCASQWEGTPNPALECLACGVPVISTPVGNMPEILRDGENGFLVERSVESIASALQTFRHMDQDTLRHNARQSILNGWTWQQQAQKYASMFRELADARPEGAIHDTTSDESYLHLLLRKGDLALAWRYTPVGRHARGLWHKVKKLCKSAC